MWSTGEGIEVPTELQHPLVFQALSSRGPRRREQVQPHPDPS